MRSGIVAVGVAVLGFASYYALSVQAALLRASQGCGETPCTITVDWGFGWAIIAALFGAGFLIVAGAFLLKPRDVAPPSGRALPE